MLKASYNVLCYTGHVLSNITIRIGVPKCLSFCYNFTFYYLIIKIVGAEKAPKQL